MIKARIDNSIVMEVLEADPFPEFHESLVWVECTADVRENWTYDGVNFQPPAITEEPIFKLPLTKLEFMDRFHDDELAAIYTAAKQNVQIEVWLDRFKLATEVDLNDPRVIAGIQTLEYAGLIAEGRSNEILI